MNIFTMRYQYLHTIYLDMVEIKIITAFFGSFLRFIAVIPHTTFWTIFKLIIYSLYNIKLTSFLIRFGNESVKKATSRRASFRVLSLSFIFALISLSSLLNSNFLSSKYSMASCPISVAPIRHLPWARQSNFKASRTIVKYEESCENIMF